MAEGQLIIDARGTVKDVTPSKPKVEEKIADTLVEKAVVAGAGALGGGLIAEITDAIQNEAKRKQVLRQVERQSDRYKDDKFADLAYGELRTVLTTGSSEEIEAARESRRLRYEEAAAYGVMTNVEGILTEELTVADWTDYPARVAVAARRAETDAIGVLAYAHNSRIRGVVSDVVGATESLVRRDGLEQIKDLTNPKNVAKLQKLNIADVNTEIVETKKKIDKEVLWNPVRNYAALVNLETPRQKEEKTAKDETERQRRHELELEKAKAEAAARGQAGSGGMDRLAPPDLRSAPEIYHDDSFFSADTLVALGIPATFYRQEGFGPYTWVDVVGLLNTYATTGVLMDESDMRALNKALALAESETPNLIGKGLLNLLKLRRKQDGTIDVYAGVENNKNSSILNETEFSFKFSAKMISKCPNMLATVLVCFEIVDGEDGSSLAVRMRDKYDIVFANSKEENQPEVDRQMGEMKKELARELSIDLGSVECVMAYVLAWGGQTANWRWGQMRERYKEIGKQEVGYLRSFVERIKVDNESLGNVLRVAGGDAFLRVVQKVPDGALLEYWNNLGSFRSFLETGRLILIGQGEGAGTENPAARERILAEHIKKNFKERWKFDLSVIKRQFDALSKRKGMAPATQETRIKTLGGFLRRIRDAF